MNRNCTLSILILFFLYPFISSAQEESPEKAEGIQLFFEKVYLHTDKDYYASGSDIWFKAYLVNGQSNYLTNTSNTLYVELISPGAELLDRKIIRMDEGTGVGDLALGDSIPSGTYRLRAYTSWMRNFGENFIFEKELKVVSLLDIALPDPASSSGKNSIQFFPEGGALLEGVAGRLAFKAEGPGGKGVGVEGAVISSGGDTVSMFQSTHLGMGLITFFPVPGEQYRVTGKLGGTEPFTASLPPLLSKGFTLQVTDAGPKELLLNICTDPATLEEYQDKAVLVAGKHAGKLVFSGEVKLNGTQSSLKLSKDYFPAGIATITLYDAEQRPQAERLVYIEGKGSEKINIAIASNKTAYQSREQVILKIKAKDQQQQAVKANLSVSVLDATIVPEGVSDIQSYLMLESEVRGKIENPKAYFDPENKERMQQMDLLLMTQGWRGFVWKKLQEEGVKISYLPEPGITISGRVRKLTSNKPMEEANISLFAPGAKGSTLFSTKTNAEGNYFLDGLEFYGQQAITLSARDQKGRNKCWILMNPLFMDILDIKPLSSFPSGAVFSELALLKGEEEKIVKADKAFRLASEEFLLNEVEIKADREKDREQMARHTTILAVNSDGGVLSHNTYDFKITEEDLDEINVGYFLEHKFPNSVMEGGDLYLRIRGEKRMPSFFLDGSSLAEPGNPYPYHVTSMPMHDVERIIVNGAFVSIFRRENPLPKKEFYRIDEMVEGYYEVREFYKPQYLSNGETSGKPDYRTTIHWESSIITDVNGEATITFYNTDRKGKVRAVVEGVTDKGVPMVSTAVYEVK